MARQRAGDAIVGTVAELMMMLHSSKQLQGQDDYQQGMLDLPGHTARSLAHRLAGQQSCLYEPVLGHLCP